MRNILKFTVTKVIQVFGAVKYFDAKYAFFLIHFFVFGYVCRI
jgi:hypothetical protein